MGYGLGLYGSWAYGVTGTYKDGTASINAVSSTSSGRVRVRDVSISISATSQTA